MRNLRYAFVAGAVFFACAGISVLAQDTGDKVELGAFGGYSFWNKKQVLKQDGTPLGVKLIDGGLVGFRATENIWRYIGVEEALTVYGRDNVRLENVPGTLGNTASFGAYYRRFVVGPVVYLAPPESRVRPFLTAGIGLNWIKPTSSAIIQAADPNMPLFGPTGPIAMGNSWKQAFNYGVGIFQFGGGVKYKFADHWGARVDLRGNFIQTPTFGIPRTGQPGTLTIANGGPINGLEATVGVAYYFGKTTPPPPPHTFPVPASIDGPTALCPGETVTLKLPVADNYGSHNAKYTWTVNGQDQNTNAPELAVKAPDSGDLTVTVHVAPDTASYSKAELKANKKAPALAADRTLSIHTKEYKQPALACSANPAELELGGTSSISGTATISECGAPGKFSWTATEGAVSGDSNATYTASGVSVDPGSQKKVTVTGTVTDAKGGTANCAVDLTVKAAAAAPAAPVAAVEKAPETPAQPEAPKAQQLDDLIFAAGNARVNNCAKRVLEDLYKQMAANPDSTIVLIGHIDQSEKPGKGHRVARNLDEQRVLNTAAVLSAGTGTCQKLELSRIRTAWVGAEQQSEFKTRFCESSVAERKGQASGNDEGAKNRRVEVWIVPKGAEMPAAAQGAKAAPESLIHAKGCPK